MKVIHESSKARMIYSPTLNLRFVNKDGRRILQQQFDVEMEYDAGRDDGKWQSTSYPSEWRDVPTENM